MKWTNPEGFSRVKLRYCVSCYGRDTYVFSIPLRASSAWLKKKLRRNDLINAVPLGESQVKALRKKLPKNTEIGWHSKLEFYLEGYHS
jgi:hypothetical protein